MRAEQVRWIDLGFAQTDLRARFLQQQQVCNEDDKQGCGGNLKDGAPSKTVAYQKAHELTAGRIAEEIAEADDSHRRAIRRVREPARSDLDRSRPAGGLHQPVADPGE